MLYDLLWPNLGMIMFHTSVNPDDLPFRCQWILSVLNMAIFKTITALESYKFSDVASTMYSWWQYQLCDVLLKQLSLSLLETHFGYVLTMGYDCFILLCRMLRKNNGSAFLHQGTRQTRELYESILKLWF